MNQPFKLSFVFIALLAIIYGCQSDSISKEDSVEGAMKQAGLKAGPTGSRSGGLPKADPNSEGPKGGGSKPSDKG